MCFPPKKRWKMNQMNQTLLKKQTKADSFLDFRWLCHWYQGFPCLFIECCFHAYFWCAFSLRRLRLTQGRQDTPSPKYENNIPWTATEIPDINTFDSLSHNLCLRYLDLQKLYNICTFGLLHMWAVLTFPRRSALTRGSAAPLWCQLEVISGL